MSFAIFVVSNSRVCSCSLSGLAFAFHVCRHRRPTRRFCVRRRLCTRAAACHSIRRRMQFVFVRARVTAVSIKMALIASLSVSRAAVNCELAECGRRVVKQIGD